MTTTTVRTGHSAACERAFRPPCACSCGGAEHGWQGALAIAAAPSDEELRRLVRDADDSWQAARREAAKPDARRRKPWQETGPGQTAAIGSFIADLVRWLRRDHNMYEATKQVGEPFRVSRDKDPDAPRRPPTQEEHERFVEGHVIPRLRHEFGGAHIDAFQPKARAAHFWCELLAQTAYALHVFNERYDQAQQAVVRALTRADEQRQEGWAALLAEEDVIRRAVALVFEHLPSIVTGGLVAADVFPLVWPVRALAVLMCREPRRHEAVRVYCVNPIVEYGSAEIREQVKERLRQAFPIDWPAPSTGDRP
ncbi:hypothetical protein [Actinomadura luteofluorescens]|uniref:hypothetical protein n=1 Tax=Actinomadura luteofluorescens TaxID=46163 RepID=UPI003D91284D